MASHPIRFGIQTAQQGIAWAELLDVWQKADAMLFAPYFLDEVQAFAEEVMPAVSGRSAAVPQ